MRRRIGFVVGMAVEARLLRHFGAMVSVGGGDPAGAARAAAALIDGGATTLISFGLAGGLDPGLAAGALVVPEAVVVGSASFPCDKALVAWLGGATAARLYAGTGIAATVAEKSVLWTRTAAAAVDLESGAVAQQAAARGVKMAVLRAVADPATHALPPAALFALDRMGQVGLTRIISELAHRPRQIPSLLALAVYAAKARKTLVRQLKRLA